MICDAVQNNLNPAEGISGSRPNCVATSAGLLLECNMETKKCIRCKTTKPLSDFYLRPDTNRRRGFCRTCETATREKLRRLRPEKGKVKGIARYAMQTGRIAIGSECGTCGSNKNMHKHHDDYSKPLEIRWLCARCHMKLHAKMRKTASLLRRLRLPIEPQARLPPLTIQNPAEGQSQTPLSCGILRILNPSLPQN